MNTIAYQLHSLFNAQKRYRFPFAEFKRDIPQNGIYVVFESGEKFYEFDRIVRIGTHTGTNQLYSRLNQHFIKENKNRSIFRKNIGRCFLNKEGSEYLKYWELDTTSREEKARNLHYVDHALELQIEKRITKYIQEQLSFIAFEVHDKEERLYWEAKIASTLAKSNEIKPSLKWLGNYSPKDKIRMTGLWQVNELDGSILTTSELNKLSNIIQIKPNETSNPLCFQISFY